MAIIKSTSILTPTGIKDISTIKVGSRVIGQNGVQNKVSSVGKRTFDRQWFIAQGRESEFKWYLINNQYQLFHTQNIFVKSGGYTVCHVSELVVGWTIYDKNGNDVLITSISEIQSEDPYIKLDISGDHSYVAAGLLLHNASRYWVGGGASTNWNATSNTNWSATDGGANNASVPGSTDDVTFNGNGASANGASVVSANITILSLTFTAGYTNTVTINSPSVVLTVAGNFTDNTAHSWTVNSTAAGALTISAASTITSGGKTFPGNVAFSGTNTKTLSGNWTITGTLTLSANTTLNWTTNESVSCAGLTVNSSQTIGTAKIILTGGTWTGNGNAVKNNMDIQGNVTLSGTCSIDAITFTYVSGTVTTTSSTFFWAGTTVTLNTNGIIFNNLGTNQSITITLTSDLTATGTFTSSGALNSVTWAGAYNVTVGTYSVTSTQACTHTFVNGQYYTITSGISAATTRVGSILTFTSDHGTNKTNIVLKYGTATCNLLANLTRIDASRGKTLRTFNGTVTSCTNCIEQHDFSTVGG